jgi:hypothetical protein
LTPNPRRPAGSGNAAAGTSFQPQQTYVRTRKRPRNAATIDICEEDESDQQDEQPLQVESPRANEQGSESGGGEADVLVMLINFIWMKICCFRLVCNFVFPYLHY